MHVRFSEDFDFTPPENRQTLLAYKAGYAGPVRRACGEAAIKAGKAVKIPTPSRDGGPGSDLAAAEGQPEGSAE